MWLSRPNMEEMERKGDVKELLKALKNYDFSVRDEAARALVRIGEPAVEHLIQALRDMDLREEAIGVLEEIGSARAVEPLIWILKDNGKARSKAARALGKIGDVRAVEPLIEALQYTFDPSVQAHAAEALGKIRDSRAVVPLIHALKYKDKHVQDKVAEVLGKMGDPRAAEAVIDWLFTSGSRGTISTQLELTSWTEKMNKLFRAYTDLILRASAYVNHDLAFHYDLGESDEAIRGLCNIHTQISNNILHKVSKKEDIQVVVDITDSDWGGTFEKYKTLSFEFQRSLAKYELDRRGYPPYDPSAYLNEDTWNVTLPARKN